MNPTMLKRILIAIFTLVFIAGFIVNSYHVYFAVGLCLILAMIVVVGGKVDKTTSDNDGCK